MQVRMSLVPLGLFSRVLHQDSEISLLLGLTDIDLKVIDIFKASNRISIMLDTFVTAASWRIRSHNEKQRDRRN